MTQYLHIAATNGYLPSSVNTEFGKDWSML